MELQHGRTPEQASARQWHAFLLAVNTFCTAHTNRTKPAEGIFWISGTSSIASRS